METIQIEPRHRAEIEAILSTHLPNFEIWAYGSRVRGDADNHSDLDLVAHNPENPTHSIHHRKLADIQDAFSESNIPFFVQLFDWANVPEEFKPNILRDKKILMSPSLTSHS